MDNRFTWGEFDRCKGVCRKHKEKRVGESGGHSSRCKEGTGTRGGGCKERDMRGVNARQGSS